MNNLKYKQFKRLPYLGLLVMLYIVFSFLVAISASTGSLFIFIVPIIVIVMVISLMFVILWRVNSIKGSYEASNWTIPIIYTVLNLTMIVLTQIGVQASVLIIFTLPIALYLVFSKSAEDKALLNIKKLSS